MSEAAIHPPPRKVEDSVDRICHRCHRLVGRWSSVETRRGRFQLVLLRTAKALRLVREVTPTRKREHVKGDLHGRCRTCYPEV